MDYYFILWKCVASSIFRHASTAWFTQDVSFPTRLLGEQTKNVKVAVHTAALQALEPIVDQKSFILCLNEPLPMLGRKHLE